MLWWKIDSQAIYVMKATWYDTHNLQRTGRRLGQSHNNTWLYVYLFYDPPSIQSRYSQVIYLTSSWIMSNCLHVLNSHLHFHSGGLLLGCQGKILFLSEGYRFLRRYSQKWENEFWEFARRILSVLKDKDAQDFVTGWLITSVFNDTFSKT